MTSDSFTSRMKSILPSFPFRQTATQGDGLQSFGRQIHHFKTVSRSSTNLLTAGSAELQSDDVTGHISPLGDPVLITQAPSVNVVLFGETGVGKSSVINLIARQDVAKVSSDVNGCTMQSTRYDISFDDMNFTIFDTIGLEEPQMGVNGYLKAIERAYELIVKLGAAGGIHLLLFCMRGGRITATTQSNYRLFCECLCRTRVPIALVFTGLEREVEMEDWWMRNKTHIEHYGIKSDGHACITAVQDDTSGEDFKYTESQKRIRELLKTCALKNEAFSPEPHSWFAKLGRGMRSFIEKSRNPKRRDVMKVLTHRCKLDPDTARRIADMMEKDDTQEMDGSQDEPTRNPEAEGASNPEVRTAGKDEKEVARENVPKYHAPPNQLGSIKAESRVDGMEGRDEVAKMSSAKNYAPPNQLGDIKVEPRIDGRDESEVTKRGLGKGYAPPDQLGAIQAEPRIDGEERKDMGVMARKDVTKDNVLSNQPGNARVKDGSRVSGMEGEDQRKVPQKNAANDDALQNQPGNVKVEPRISATDREDQRKVLKKTTKDNVLQNQPGIVKTEPRTSAMHGNGLRKVSQKNAVKDGVLQNQPGDVKAESHTSAMDGRDPIIVPQKDAGRGDDLRNQPGDVNAEPRISVMDGKDTRKVLQTDAAKDDVLPNQPDDVKAKSRIPATEREDQRKALKKRPTKDDVLQCQLGDVSAGPRTIAMEGESQRKVLRKAMKGNVLQNQSSDVRTEPRVSVMDWKDPGKVLKNITRDDALPNQQDDVEVESCIDEANDGGQHRSRSGGDQPLGADIAEQARQDDAKKKSVSSVSFPAKWVVDSVLNTFS